MNAESCPSLCRWFQVPLRPVQTPSLAELHPDQRQDEAGSAIRKYQTLHIRKPDPVSVGKEKAGLSGCLGHHEQGGHRVHLMENQHAKRDYQNKNSACQTRLQGGPNSAVGAPKHSS